VNIDRLREIVKGSRPSSVPPRAVGSRELVYVPLNGDGSVVDRPWRLERVLQETSDLSEVAGAREVSTPFGTCLVIARDYAPADVHGALPIADLFVEPDDTFDLLAGRPITGDRPTRAMYVDLETTGLSGGAGTVAFLVGFGWADGEGFHVRQVFLPAYAAERAVLSVVTDLVRETDCLVTYNGRTFDIPVMETRGAFHRLTLPLCDLPHLDMLPPARRLWRSASLDGDDSCRLVALEQALLRVTRAGDVPGHEIPGRYFSFVRRGATHGLDAVFEHNRLDLLSLAALTAKAQTLVHGGPSAAATTGERVGLGRLYERAGRLDDAEAAYRSVATDRFAEATVRRTAWRAVALLCRKARRHGEAADAWESALGLDERPERLTREAREALAIHHEHRVRDLEAARLHAERALAHAATESERDALRRRIDRLERKIARRGPATGRFWDGSSIEP
jgi:hypothetical protein